MKKVLIACFLAVALMGVSFADTTSVQPVEPVNINFFDTLKALPETKHGVAFSALDSKMNYLVTFQVANFSSLDVPVLKNLMVDVGYAGATKGVGDKVVGVISYPLFDAGNYTQWPIIKYIKFNPGLYVGAGRVNIGNGSDMKGNNEFDFGVAATALEVKF